MYVGYLHRIPYSGTFIRMLRSRFEVKMLNENYRRDRYLNYIHKAIRMNLNPPDIY